MKVIHILSGGVDSTTALYWLLDKGYEIKAISFDYGQRHKKELKFASDICKKLKLEHKIIDITGITELISNSVLTSDLAVPQGHYESANMKQTVVPSRNSIMAIIANAYAVNLDYDAICLGVHSGDHAIYPDCRSEFIDALKKLFAVNNYKNIKVLAPYLKVDKTAIISDGKKLGVDYSMTWTCYAGQEKACGKCGSCQERLEAFRKNGVEDPLVYDIN